MSRRPPRSTLTAPSFPTRRSSDLADQTRRQMRASLQDRSLIVGVDRLDYSKGLEERFFGYERFLKDHPGYHRNVVLVQIAPPRSEEHTSELQSLMRPSYAVFCLKKKINRILISILPIHR